MRRGTVVPFVLVALLVSSGLAIVPASLVGQDDSSSRRRRVMRATVAHVDEVARGLPAKKRARAGKLRTVVREVLRSISAEEVAHLETVDAETRLREIAVLARRLRHQRDEELLARLEPSEADELRSVPVDVRRRRLAALRVDMSLENAITNAMRHGLLSDVEAEELRRLDHLEAKLAAIRELAKNVFLGVHGEKLTSGERRRLAAVDPREFFSDHLVRRFRLRQDIPRAEIVRVRGLSPKQRRELMRSVRDGADFEPWIETGVLSRATVRRLAAIDEDRRRRVAEELRRFHFPRAKRFSLPGEFRRRLSADEIERLRGASDEERLGFLESRFLGIDWRARKRLFDESREVESRLEPILKPWQLARLRVFEPERALQRLGHWLKEHPEREQILEFVTSSVLMSRPAREFRRQLSDEEFCRYRCLTAEERIGFLEKRDPTRLQQILERAARRLGAASTPEWSELDSHEKFRRLVARMDEPAILTVRRIERKMGSRRERPNSRRRRD